MLDSDPGSLDRLHDIVSPPPAPWWPPAPGWYALGLIVLLLLGVGAWAVPVRLIAGFNLLGTDSSNSYSRVCELNTSLE